MGILGRVTAGLLFAGLASAQTAPKGIVLVLVGPVGSGKTTQATYLTKKLKIPVIAVDEIRASGTKLDEALRQRVQQADAARGFILDGYPSTRAQAEFLDALVKERRLPAPLIVQIDVKDDVVRQRLKSSGKAEDQGTRLDQRLAEYHREMDLYRSYYPQSDIWTINGDKPPAEVSNTILSLLADRQ